MAAAAINISASSPSHLLHIPKKPPSPHFQLSKPNNKNNIPILLQQSVQTNNIHLATATHAQILKHPNTYLFNTLITSYFKLGLSSYAFRVFQNVQNPDVVTFTSMVSWLAKCCNEYEGVDMFVEMMRCGIDPNEYSFVAVLTACGRVFDIDLGSGIHGLVVKMGFEDDVFVMNALMGFYGKCGCLDLVVKMFDEMSVRDVSSWNTVLSCLVKGFMFGEALELFREMVWMDGVGIDHFTVSAVLSACSEHGAVMEGREVHVRAIKFGLERNLSVGNALIGFYSKYGNVKNVVSLFDRMVVKDVITWTQLISFYMELGLVDMAEEVFDTMPERNCVSYNTLLSGFCQNGDGVRALRMFCRMLEEGVELDEYSLAIIMNACGLHEDKSASEQIHGFVLKFGFGSNDRVESALLDMCTKCGRMTDAEEMFNSDLINQNSSIIWTSMICGYARNGNPYEALSLFFKGQSENTMVIDEMVLTTVLGLCATLGFDRIGEQIHSSALRSGMLHDIKVENALIGMYSKCGNIAAAIKVFDNMKRLDVVSWNSLMSGYIFNKQGDKALDLWAEMKMANIKPDSITALLIVSAYTHTTSNMVNECYRFFQSMKTAYNIEPTSEHYVSLVNVFGHWGLLKEAEDIIKKMPFEPNTFVWRALLDNCRTPINTDIGKRAAKEILSKKPNDPSTYILVSNLYSASGRWQCSETIREEMREKGIQKRPGKSWIIHENKVHSFYARDKSHTLSKDIYSGLDILVLKCLKAGYVPDTSFVLHEVEEHQKRDFLYYHSAKLAVTYGLLMTKGTPVRVMKNILLCGDCHTFFKYASAVTKREIHIRDASGFHCFVNELKQSKIDGAKDEMNRRVNEIEQKKSERAKLEKGGYSSLQSMGSMGRMDNGFSNDMGISNGNTFGSGSGFGITSDVDSFSSKPKDRPSVAVTTPAKGMGMRLGKSQKANQFLESLKAEGEMIVEDVRPNANLSKAAGPSPTDPVTLTAEEKLNVTLMRDGGLSNFDVQGTLSLQILNEDDGFIQVQIESAGNPEIKFKTHPNINKDLFSNENILGSKDSDRPFPAGQSGDGLGLLKWRMQSKDESAVPLTNKFLYVSLSMLDDGLILLEVARWAVNCWPSVSGNETYVSIEYEASSMFDLQNVVISVPLPALRDAPNVKQIDGEWRFDSRNSILEWSILLIDNSNRSGSMEFVVPPADTSAFFPISVRFSATSTFSDMKVASIVPLKGGPPPKYSQRAQLVTESYQVV